MKSAVIIIIFLGQFNVYAQDSIQVIPVKEFELKAERFIGVDDFENLYYIKNNTFYKQTQQQTYSYTNTLLGEITSVDLKNSLKILLFYSNFNSALLLDNRLNELTEPFNFTTASFSKNIAFANLSSNNNLWLYSLDDNILRLWNHLTKKIQFTSQPLTSYASKSENFKAVQQFSSYKNCWLVGRQENTILQFDEYGIFLGDLKTDPFDELKPISGGYIYLKENKLYLRSFKKKSSSPLAIKKGVSIKSFYVNNDQIYIFDGTTIFVFKILKN